MENAFKSLSSSSAKSPSFMASKQYHSVHHQPSRAAPPFPQPPATPPQPPLLPQPARLHAPPQQHAAWPASRPVPQRSKKPRHATAAAALSPKKTAPAPAQGASAPIPVQAAPSKKRTGAASEAVEWTATDSLYSVSPPPSCVPMPTSLLVGAAAASKAPTACAVEVAGGGVDVGATDELRRLLRL